MYDGVTVAELPDGAQLYAGYVDGHYANTQALAERFPAARHVPIAVFASTNEGVVLDVEQGDASPAEAPGWVQMRRAHGIDPSVYCNADTWPAVRDAFHSAGVAEPHYWIAKYDGMAEIPIGAVAKQFESTAGYDRSVVADYWPGIDPAPAPAPQSGYGPPFPGEVLSLRSPVLHDGNVQTWQARMRARGWSIVADGWYGPASKAVCLAFQNDSTAHGWPLVADGEVGPATWAAAWNRPVS
jgi:hypothetical protein